MTELFQQPVLTADKNGQTDTESTDYTGWAHTSWKPMFYTNHLHGLSIAVDSL